MEREGQGEETGKTEKALSAELERNLAQALEQAQETEFVVQLIRHIQNPCGTTLPSGEEVNLRDFYLRQAEEVLPKLTNPNAIELLKAEIERWRKEKEEE
jgi:hypothetical protein